MAAAAVMSPRPDPPAWVAEPVPHRTDNMPCPPPGAPKSSAAAGFVAARRSPALRRARRARAAARARLDAHEWNAAPLVFGLADEKRALGIEEALSVGAGRRDPHGAERFAAETLEVERRAAVEPEATVGVGARVDHDAGAHIDARAEYDLGLRILDAAGAPGTGIAAFACGGRRRAAPGARASTGARAGAGRDLEARPEGQTEQKRENAHRRHEKS
jgi:hypothetical protein